MSALKEILAKFGFQVDSKELDKGEAKADKFTSSLRNAAKTVAATFASAAVLAGIRNVTTELLATGDAITDTSAALGVGRKDLQAWQYMGGQVGAGAEDMAASFKFLQKNAVDGAAAFKKIGVSAKGADGHIKGASQLLGEVADGIAGVSDPAEQTKLALELLGKGGTKLLPILKGGQSGVNELRKRFEELGGGLSEEALDALDATGDAMADLELSTTSLKGEIFLAFGPAIRHAIGFFTNMTAALRQGGKDSATLRAGMVVLGTAAAAAGVAALAPWLPFIAAIGGAFLLVQDFMVFMKGGDSVTGRLLDKLFGEGASGDIRGKLQKFGLDLAKGFEDGAKAGSAAPSTG